jgi:ATP-dependent Lhr-like helicase
MATTFSRLHPRLQQAIVARLGWTSLRPVQEEAGAALLDGNNAVILAPTAGGKTEASMFPVLSELLTRPTDAVGALYLAPIKALLNNQADRLGRYTEMVGLDRTVWHGDVGAGDRARFLKEPTELLMTTPESLEVMLISKRVDAAALFADLRVVVIDEVHALAGTDRGAHLMSVIERIAALSRHDVQRAGLSATVGNPDVILGWLGGTSARPGVVVDPPKPPSKRMLAVTWRPDLDALGRDAAAVARGQKSLLFCQSRAVAESLAGTLRDAGTHVFVHHSAVSKEEREEAEANFHQGRDATIVCTSTLELGIDVGDLDQVLQAEAPDTVGSFLQRMGRTGRRPGKAANTTFLCTTGWTVAQALALIDLARRGWVESVAVDDRCWPVLVHQLFAMALAGDGVTAERAWAHLSRVPDFRGVERAEFDRLVRHLVRDRSLDVTSGLLVLGPRAERKFGRRNFMELYAVFSSPATYHVETPNGRPLGTLSQSFVDRLVEGASSFLLGGRPWSAQSIDHNGRRIVAAPAPFGVMPRWGGMTPQFLGFELCQAVRDVLRGDAVPDLLHASAREVLAEMRVSFDGLLDDRTGGFDEDADGVTWWTFAGGRINTTLRHALEARGGDWKVSTDNFRVRLTGEGVTQGAVAAAVNGLRSIEAWRNSALWDDVAAGLPSYRLSKFQDVLPPWVVQEMLASFLLDVEGAWRWVSGDEGASLPRPRPTGGGPPMPAELPPPTFLAPRLPIRWVRTDDELVDVCRDLAREPIVALDVETTLRDRALCLVQLACPRYTALIDPLSVDDLSPLAELLAPEAQRTLIHNAVFERAVLGKLGVTIGGVVDTLALSRARRPGADSHTLAAVVERELGFWLDKTCQTSDWRRRPLTDAQVNYAALDAEVLLLVHRALDGP